MASSSEIEQSCSTSKWLKYRLQHKWIIEDFSLYYLDHPEGGEKEKPTKAPYICSEPFRCSEDGRLEFQLELYPKGNDGPECKDYISFYLRGPSNVTVKFTLSILIERSEPIENHQIMKFTHFFPLNGSSFGSPNLIKHKVLIDTSKGFLLKDTLTLLGKVDVYLKPSCQQKHQIRQLEALQLTAIEENSRVYGNLLESGHLSDAVLVVGGTCSAGRAEETQSLPVHRAILGAHSPVFKAMFQCEMSESSDGHVVIDDLSGDALKKLLQFIYTGRIEFAEEIAEELLHAADKYEVEQLKNICGRFLCGKVNLKTVIRLFILADRHSVDHLKSAAIEFIRLHMAELVLDHTWPLIDKLVVEELRKQAAESREDTREQGKQVLPK